MSKPGVNNPAAKQDNSQVKKENRSSSGNTPNIKDEKRSSESLGNQQQKSNSSNQNQNRGGQTSNAQRSNQQRTNDSQNRDRSGNRNDNRHFEKNKPETKGNEEDKHSSDPSSTGVPTGEKKFTGRCRLFVGNLTPDISEDEFRKMFEAYGEVSEIYLNPSRGFGFIRLDYRQNAEAAKVGLDGSQRKGRVLRVRFATHGAALKVKNLHPFVSNELLEHSFSQFGELERCVVIVDDRGKSTGEGIVEFVRKPGANSALRRITEGVFLMGMDPKPVFVEPLEHKDEEDGLPEKLLTRNEQYKKEREKDPRFAPPGTFEFEFGMRWKQLDELEKQRVEQVKKDIENDRLKLEDEMQNALFEYQADQIRHELARQQEELRRLEELRNQDRLRRQQEYELRHQQEDRERAQQEERRRADTMMLMRQHELARGRAAGTMDMSALGREDMMMADRFGDRMPDRMPDRMADRMPDRMGEHMGDRMPERMGDRMPERMGDRMSSGQSGFMWDDKQREDTSPKSLMQAAGYNMGSAPGGGPGSGAPSMSQGPGAPDPNAMDEDCTEDTSISKSEDSQETNVSDLPSDELGKHEACLATFRSPDMQNEHCLHEDHDLQSDAQNSHVDNRMHVDLLDADLGSRSLRDAGDISNTASTSSQGRSSPHASSISEQSQSEAASELPSDDSTAKFASYEDGHLLTDPGSQTASNWKQPEDRGFSTPQVTCTERGSVKHSGRVVLPCSEVDTHCSHSADVLAADATIVRDSEDDSNNQMVVNVSSNCLNDTSDIDTNCQLRDFDCSADTEVYNQEDSVNQNVPVTSRTDQRPVTVHPQNTASLHLSSNPQSGLPSQYSRSPDCCGMDQVPHSTSFTGSQCLSHGVLVPETEAAEESHDLSEASIEESGSHNQNICLSYEEASVEAHDREQSLSEEDQYEHSTGCHNEQSLESEPDSSNYTHPSLDCSTHDNYHVDSDSEVSSYRQHIANDAEEMDTGVLDDEDVPDVTVNSSVYQSYEDDTETQYEAGAAAVGLVDMPLVAHYDTTDSHITEVNPSEEVSNVAVLCSSPTVGDDTASSSTACVPLQDTVTDAATSPTEEVTTSTASSSPSLSSHQHIGSLSEQERMFSHGEQAFMAARQAASVPFVQAGCQMPYVPGMNPSMYAGAAMVQGLAGPTMMTSSSMHIAQHPGGGATIMQQHQSMSSGGMSQATLMQQQSMANGVQATSLMQRTLTNGGQTMLVQQRTMTTGLDGMTQQTMVQQQMATPGMQSAAMFHANAMRQRTLASQQASMMQQRIRLVQTGVVGNPMMHAQAMGGPTLIRGGNMPTLIQHGMLRGISQGTMMQQLVRQRYLGGPVMPGRGIQLMAGRPIRVKMTYPRESMQMDT